MIRYREIENFKFADIFRIFISGSSATGKTHFAKELLKQNIFKFSRIYYFHPDFHEHSPVNWHNEFDRPVLYQAGIPSLRELLEIPEYSCLVFDDLFSQCCESKDIDYLFRVLSSARVNGLQIFIDILSKRYQVIIGRMKYYLISEADFSSNFTVKGKNIANANKKKSLRKRQISSESSDSTESSEDSSESCSDTSSDSESRVRHNEKLEKNVRRHKSASKFLRKNK